MTRLLWIADAAPPAALHDALRDDGCVLLCSEPGERATTIAHRLAPRAVLLQGAAATALLRRLRAGLPRAVLVLLLPAPSAADELQWLGLGADLVIDASAAALLLPARLRRWLQHAADEPPAALPLLATALSSAR